MTWILDSAKTVGDVCEIVYSETTQDEEGNNVVATRTVKHHRTSFSGNLQTMAKWKANIKQEIAADLSELNKVAPAPVDITAQVR